MEEKHDQKRKDSIQSHHVIKSMSSSVLDNQREKLLMEKRSCDLRSGVELKQKDMNKPDHDVFQELYLNKRGERQKKSKVRDEATHRPVIDSISRDIVGDVSFQERMSKYQSDHEQKRQQRKASEKQEKENMYKPKTGSAPFNRNVEKLPIGDFLYQNRRKKTVVVAKPQPIPKINQTSRHLYEKKKEEVFEKIFRLLEGHDDGVISWKYIDIEALDARLQPIMTPLLE